MKDTSSPFLSDGGEVVSAEGRMPFLLTKYIVCSRDETIAVAVVIPLHPTGISDRGSGGFWRSCFCFHGYGGSVARRKCRDGVWHTTVNRVIQGLYCVAA